MTPHIRSDKHCLNCGTYVEERYCTHCGQENVEVKESLGHLINHFFADLTHYDSKLFVTLKDLLFKPGFLTKEYLAGRRTRYLHPVRMYVFVSFIYFLISLSMNDVEERTNDEIATTAARAARKEIADSLKSELRLKNNNPARDSVVKSLLLYIDSDSTPDKDLSVIFNITSRDLVVFDSLQRLLPESKRQTGLKPWLYEHWLKTYKRFGRRGSVLLVRNRTEHLTPKLMFFLLPLFAWLLKCFYDRKKYFYVDHLIFSLHFHTAVFLLFSVFAICNLIAPSISRYFNGVEYILVLIYLGVALFSMYRQSVLLTILKVIMLTICYTLFIVIGFVLLVTTVML